MGNRTPIFLTRENAFFKYVIFSNKIMQLKIIWVKIQVPYRVTRYIDQPSIVWLVFIDEHQAVFTLLASDAFSSYHTIVIMGGEALIKYKITKKARICVKAYFVCFSWSLLLFKTKISSLRTFLKIHEPSYTMLRKYILA